MDTLASLYEILTETSTPDGCRSTIRLRTDHAIFRAHFPHNPITPGACIVEIAGALLSRHLGRRLRLQRAASVKFIHTLRPTEVGAICFCYSHLIVSDTSCTVRVEVKDEQKIYTKLTLSYTL